MKPLNFTSIPENTCADNPWRSLREFTHARIGLGRAGISLPTRHLLEFQLAHASAKDAVEKELDWKHLESELTSFRLPIFKVKSQAQHRAQYLQRPDLGRKLNPASRDYLKQELRNLEKPSDISFIVSDGLSASAIENHAVPLLEALFKDIGNTEYRYEFLILAEQARVALGDEIIEITDTDFSVMLIGERPGLSSPDSLGVYFTYQARSGFTDAQRNCISNIRPEGLSYAEASKKIIWLMDNAKALGSSGVMLKDESEDETLALYDPQQNFLLE